MKKATERPARVSVDDQSSRGNGIVGVDRVGAIASANRNRFDAGE